MLTYNHMLSVTPSDVRGRARKVTATITKAELVNRGGKKGYKFSAKGRAATEKVYYEVTVELYPEKQTNLKTNKPSANPNARSREAKQDKGIQQIETPNDNMECFVKCQCPAFIFKSAWVLWKNGSSELGECENKPPYITNPEMTPYVCKHIFKIAPMALKALQQIATD
jgi:hypothetical protein